MTENTPNPTKLANEAGERYATASSRLKEGSPAGQASMILAAGFVPSLVEAINQLTADRDAAQHVIESHTCGENIESIYRRTLEVQNERDALAAIVAEALALVQPIPAPAGISEDDLSDAFYAERQFASHLRGILRKLPADALAAREAKVLRDYADRMGVDSDEYHDGDEWWSGYRQAQRDIPRDMHAAADRIEREVQR